MGGGVLSSLFKKILGSAGDDIATKVSSQYGDDVIRNLATSSADDIAAKQGNLIATHQLTADKLKGVADMGGFVQPSVAVVDPSKGTNFLPGSGFGEIVMIPNREAINPARAAAKTVIGDRDIYSPRFPQVSYEANMDEVANLVKNSDYSKQSLLSNLGLDDEPLYSNVVRDLYAKQNPEIANLGSRDLREHQGFMEFGDELFGRLRGDKVIKYHTPSGASKSLPLTAENANKVMNKSGTVGSEQGWQTPNSRAYHQNTKYIKSLDDLYKNRYRFIDSQTGEATKDAITGELGNISNRIDEMNLPMFTSDNPYTRFDDIGNYVADAASGQRNLYPALDELPDEVVNDIGRLQRSLQEAPVSYFEAKPRRVVGGNEFYGAYVPQDAPQSVIDDLQRLGVTNVNRYLDAGDLDLSLAQLAKEGKRGISPYVLGLGGIVPAGGILGAMFSGNGNDQQPMA